MEVGMLWFDADPGTAAALKIERAAVYYRSKYGASPTLCFVHPGTEGVADACRVGELEVRTSGAVLPAHFWLGRGEPGAKRRHPEAEAAA